MTTGKDILYAAVGVGDLVVSKAREAQDTIDLSTLREVDLAQVKGKLQTASNKALDRGLKAYTRLVERGEKTIKSIRNSAPTKKAVAQTKTARTQTKAAVTSVKKAAATTVEATKQAASNL